MAAFPGSHLERLERRFIGRRLFKAVDLDMNAAEQADFLAAARECVSRAGFDPEYYFIEDRASDVPYYNYYTVAGAQPKSRIYVEDGYARPVIREISEVSDVVRGLQGYELHRVCFPAEVKQIYALYHKRSESADRLEPGARLWRLIWQESQVLIRITLTVMPKMFLPRTRRPGARHYSITCSTRDALRFFVACAGCGLV